MSEMKREMDQPATRGDVKTIVQATVQAVIRDEMRGLLRPIVATLAQHTEELADLRSRMVTRDEFHSRMDAFSGLRLELRDKKTS